MNQEFTPIIEVTQMNGNIEAVALTSDSVTIGRSIQCAVRLSNPRVSRHHARLDRGNDAIWQVTDLGSDNGTLLDGMRIAPDQSMALSSGCLLSIGPFTIRFLTNARELEKEFAHSSPRSAGLRLSDESKLIQTLAAIAPPKLSVTQLRSLEEFGRLLLTIEHADQRLQALCRLILDEPLGGKWAVVIRGENAPSSTFRPMCDVARKGNSSEDFPLSRSLIQAALTRHEPVLATNVVRNAPGSGDALQMSISDEVASMVAIAVPLGDCAKDEVSLLYATFPPEYGTGEWLALCALAARNYLQGEAVWRNLQTARRLAQIEAEVERARQVQRRLIPTECDLPGFDVAIRFSPCNGMAGDYVDALALSDGRSLFVIADVVGKGIPAALVAVGVQTIVRVAVRRWMGLQDLANVLDTHLVETLKPGAFVTLLAMTIDPTTGEVEVVNGGHPPAIVFNSDGRGCRETATRGGIMFGPFPQSRELYRDRLYPSETLALFTDGHFEIFDSAGRMLELEGLCGLIGDAVVSAADSSSAAEAVVELTERWRSSGEPRDDQTLMVIRRKLI